MDTQNQSKDNGNKAWFKHSDIADRGKLVLVMSNKPDRNWRLESLSLIEPIK